jgi:MFS family permease
MTERISIAKTAFPLVAAIGIACGVTVTLLTVFSYLSKPIGADLGLSPTETSLALTLHLGMLIIALPLAGLVADRFGARPTIIISTLLFAASLVAISQVESKLALYATFALAGLAGGGASPITYARVIVHHFTRRRGLALGIALAGVGLGGIVLPMIVQPVVAAEGWRSAITVLAAIVAVAGLVGGLLAQEGASEATSTQSEGYSMREAATTRAFWQMTLAFMVLGLALAALTAHLTTIWEGLGLNAAQVPQFQAVVGIATIGGRLVGGAAMDKWPAHWVGSAAALIGAAGIALLATGASSVIGIALAGIAFGLCSGTESDVVSYLSSHYFGIKNFARIYATQGSFFMVGLALGPLAAASALEALPTTIVVASVAALLLLSAIILLFLKAPPAKTVFVETKAP